MILNHLSQAGNVTEKDKNALIAAIHEQNKSKYDKVDRIAEYQKYVNTELDYGVFEPASMSIGSTKPLVFSSVHAGNMQLSESGYIKLQKGKAYVLHANLYKIDAGCGVTLVDSALNPVTDASVSSYGSYVCHASEDMEVTFVAEDKYTAEINPSWASVNVYEIGRAITIDPVEHVNTSSGIEDAPVGHIITCLGGAIPKHYLACDGSIYNIADYAYLAQYITENFGAVNHFGGDGISAFAVPKRGGVTHDYTPIMTGDTTPSPFVVSAKDCSSGQPAYKAFNGTVANDADCWAASTEKSWLKIDFGRPIVVNQFAITGVRTNVQFSPKDFVISGSNDDIHYDTLYVAENQSWTSAETKEYVLNDACTYRYFKIDILAANGAKYGAISLWKFYHITTNDYIKYEPTYYMQVHQTNYIQHSVYSEEEQVIGKWIDGKPLYRKSVPYAVATLPAVASGSVWIANLSDFSSDIDQVIYLEASSHYTYNGSSRFETLPATYVALRVIGDRINVMNANSSGDITNMSGEVHLEYTKTTDTENSFTNDMIQDYVTTEPYSDEQVLKAVDALWP